MEIKQKKYVHVVRWTVDGGETLIRVFDHDAYEEVGEFYKNLQARSELLNKKLLASVTTHEITQQGDST